MESEGKLSYSLVMAKNLYGKLLLRDKARLKEATMLLKDSEELASALPHWWDDLDHICQEEFDLS